MSRLRLDYDIHEMLILRSKGMSYHTLGRRYKKDHTTIIHHCQKWSVFPGSTVPDKDMLLGHYREYVNKHFLFDPLDPPTNKEMESGLRRRKYGSVSTEEETETHTYKWYLEQAEKRAAERHYKEHIGYLRDWKVGD